MSRLTRFCFACGRSLEFLNSATEGQEALQQPDNSRKKSKCCITVMLASVYLNVYIVFSDCRLLFFIFLTERCLFQQKKRAHRLSSLWSTEAQIIIILFYLCCA